MDLKDVAGAIQGMVDIEEKADAVVLLPKAARKKALQGLEPEQVAIPSP
jgi:hypothetical protein